MFQFKQFAIDDSASGLKTGTDGVLLGAWADTDGLRTDDLVTDAGAGCGLIALMLAQRCPARIDAVETDAGACADCGRNFAASPWAARLDCIEGDFLKYSPQRRPRLIVSNPPFFSTGERAHSQSRATARHEDSLPLSALIDRAAQLLAPDGRLALIIPSEREDDMIFHATISGLTPSRICRMITVEGKAPRRLLAEMVKGRCSYSETTLAIRRTDGTFTDRYTELVKDFYLKM